MNLYYFVRVSRSEYRPHALISGFSELASNLSRSPAYFEKAIPRLAAGVKKNGFNEYPTDIPACDFYALTAENVSIAEAAERFNADQNRPRARQADADASEGKRCRIAPAGAQMFFGKFQVTVIERLKTPHGVMV